MAVNNPNGIYYMPLVAYWVKAAEKRNLGADMAMAEFLTSIGKHRKEKAKIKKGDEK